jgi:hypothetical protein
LLGQAEDASIVHREEVALVADVAALPEVADDVDRLFEHHVADVCWWPAFANDVLIQVLAGAEAERESVVAHQPDGGRHLRHDRRVIADDWTGDHGHELHAAGLTRHGPKHAPGEGALALLFEPRMEVIRDDGEIEAGSLGLDAVADEFLWISLLAHQGVAKGCHQRTSLGLGACCPDSNLAVGPATTPAGELSEHRKIVLPDPIGWLSANQVRKLTEE